MATVKSNSTARDFTQFDSIRDKQAALVRNLEGMNLADRVANDTALNAANNSINAPVLIDPDDTGLLGKQVVFSSEYAQGASHVMYTGANARAYALLRGHLFDLNNLQTFSYSIFREKYEVQTIGSSNVRGHTRGTRTVAGSLIFAAAAEHPFLPMLRTALLRTTYSGTTYPDELLPFDMVINFTSNSPYKTTSGDNMAISSRIIITGINLTSDASTWSIHQPSSEVVMQFTALDVSPLVRDDAEIPGPGQRFALAGSPEGSPLIDVAPITDPLFKKLSVDPGFTNGLDTSV
jgi:hypothetical protein